MSMELNLSELVTGMDKEDMLEVYFMEKFDQKSETDFVAAATALFKGNIYAADKSFKKMYHEFEKGTNGEIVTYKEFVDAAKNTIDTYKAMLPLSVGLKVASELQNVNAIFDAYYRTLDNEFNESLDPEVYPLAGQEPVVDSVSQEVKQITATDPSPTTDDTPATASITAREPIVCSEDDEAILRYGNGSLGGGGKSITSGQSKANQEPVEQYLSTSSLGTIDCSKK